MSNNKQRVEGAAEGDRAKEKIASAKRHAEEILVKLGPATYTVIETTAKILAYDVLFLLRQLSAAVTPERDVPEDDNYVAYLRFGHRNDNPDIAVLRVCDSDAQGAFKVYRRPASSPIEPPAPVSDPLLELEKQAFDIQPILDGEEDAPAGVELVVPFVAVKEVVEKLKAEAIEDQAEIARLREKLGRFTDLAASQSAEIETLKRRGDV
jgi:hypothetical protein